MPRFRPRKESSPLRTIRSTVADDLGGLAREFSAKRRGEDKIDKAEICEFYREMVRTAAAPSDLVDISLRDLHGFLWERGFRQARSRDDFSNVKSALRKAVFEIGAACRGRARFRHGKMRSLSAEIDYTIRTNGSMYINSLRITGCGPPWRPSGFVIDDLDASIDAIMETCLQRRLSSPHAGDYAGDAEWLTVNDVTVGSGDHVPVVEIPGSSEGEVVALTGTHRLRIGASVVVLARRSDLETDGSAPRADSALRLLSFAGTASLGGDAAVDTEDPE